MWNEIFPHTYESFSKLIRIYVVKIGKSKFRGDVLVYSPTIRIMSSGRKCYLAVMFQMANNERIKISTLLFAHPFFEI